MQPKIQETLMDPNMDMETITMRLSLIHNRDTLTHPIIIMPTHNTITIIMAKIIPEDQETVNSMIHIQQTRMEMTGLMDTLIKGSALDVKANLTKVIMDNRMVDAGVVVSISTIQTTMALDANAEEGVEVEM